MSVTIEDIARHLNLSVSTVSKALNDYKDVSDETKRRVLEAARELDYHPSAAARSLRRKRSNKIGLLLGYPVPAISEYVAMVITGVMMAAEESGYDLILYPLRVDQSGLLIRICRSREVDGLLLMGTAQMDQRVALLQSEGIPFVVLDRRVESADVSYVAADNLGGAQSLTQHLIELGHRRIGYTDRPDLGTLNQDRRAGYVRALSEAGIPLEEELIVQTAAGATSGGDYAMSTLLDLPDPPTAVFGIHDVVAIEALQVATERGLRVPDDVAVVGFGDLYSTHVTQPPLTTARVPMTDLGQRAMETLVTRMTDGDRPAVHLSLPVHLVKRQSTVGVV
jgi:LacI family transcriptional regulator